jgi:hypothetical protein
MSHVFVVISLVELYLILRQTSGKKRQNENPEIQWLAYAGRAEAGIQVGTGYNLIVYSA